MLFKANSHIPCRSHAVPLLCLAAKALDCVFPIWFTQCGRVGFTHAMPRPCHAETMSFWKRLLKATAQRDMGAALACHGTCELASVGQRRHVDDLPAFGFLRLPHGVPRDCYQKHTSPLNCRTSSSDIFGYHAGFHEGHGTVGEWQGRDMACMY
jgi:hypothetical protein